MATRVVGQLDVSNAAQVTLQRCGQVTFHALGMVDVVLDIGVVRGDFIQYFERLEGSMQVEARNVEGVDRLDQQL